MTTSAHLVAHAPNGWGHNKPLLALLARVVEHCAHAPITLTLLTSVMILPKITRELALMPGAVSAQINVIDVGMPFSFFAPNMGVLTALEALRDGKPVVCQSTKTEYTLPPASFVVLAVFLGPPIFSVKAAAGGCPVIAWVPSPMSSCLLLLGPEVYGGYGNMDEKAAAAAREQGKTELEVADSLYNRAEGKVIRIAGLPDVYDYEYHPQANAIDVSPFVFLRGAHSALVDADGVLVATSSAFEAESINASRKWLAETGKQIWVVGPLEDVPPSVTTNIPGNEVPQHTEEDAKILGFLNDMLRNHGTRSVILIAFGTTHYPKDPTKLHTFIDELIVSGTPFLWSHASPLAKVPEEVDAKIAGYERGLHANWIPQRAVLRHPATGWFVSHGGWNSLQEALSLRVPLVMWPFIGDQPSNAALLSITHEAAFELLSVRSGLGARQPLRMEGEEPVDFSIEGVRKETRELLVKLKGSEGVRVRSNAERLGVELDKSWKEGGEASGELQSFLSKFFGSA